MGKGDVWDNNELKSEWNEGKQVMLCVCFSPVGSTVELRMYLLLHHPPRRCGDEKLFVDAVSEAVRDATWKPRQTHKIRTQMDILVFKMWNMFKIKVLIFSVWSLKSRNLMQ